MTIYEKLNKAKKALSAAGLKKSGKNDFAKYEYFELGDFLPTIVALEDELKFTCVVSFDKDLATLRVTDSEKPDSVITFASPMSEANLKGMHAVQNLGAVQTYLRRYLYVNAFEIVEADPLDRTATRPDKPQAEAPKTEPIKYAKALITPEQYAEIQRACVGADGGTDQEQVARLKEVLGRYGYKTGKEVRQEDYDKIKTEFIEYGLPFKI